MRFQTRLVGLVFIFLCLTTALHAQRRRMTEDRDLVPIDLSKMDCPDLSGSAKTQDGVERNQGKNRAMVDLSQLSIPSFETASFLKAVSFFDAQTQGSRRKDLTPAQQAQLAGMEKQIVSFTGYLVLAYPGPPETTNCGSVDFHDWHLEVFEKPMDHPPEIGDPTPIICEITPRVQNMFYEAGIRLKDLAAFMRLPDQSHESNGHPARRVRFTGYLLWDDDHNGSADIGPRINEKAKNGYHRPWRSTAFEIHPVLKIEALDGPAPGAAPPVNTSLKAEVVAAAPVPPVAPPAPVSTPAVATILEPITIKIPYGETVIPRGTRAEVVSRDAKTVIVRYLGQDVLVPLSSTDLR